MDGISTIHFLFIPFIFPIFAYMITMIENKQLIYDIDNYDVILIGTSINNALGNGFQYQIKKSFPEVDIANKNTPYGDIRKLGTVQVVNKYNKTFCLCYINKSRRRPDLYPDYLEYTALESCMQIINKNFKNKKIASTILGNSVYEGDGDKEKIMQIICDNTNDVDITLYDFQQQDFKQERRERWNDIVNSIGKVSAEEYKEMKKKFHWQNAYGPLSTPPTEMSEHEIKQFIKQNKTIDISKEI